MTKVSFLRTLPFNQICFVKILYLVWLKSFKNVFLGKNIKKLNVNKNDQVMAKDILVSKKGYLRTMNVPAYQ